MGLDLWHPASSSSWYEEEEAVMKSGYPFRFREKSMMFSRKT
jgi:hypothetical protein